MGFIIHFNETNVLSPFTHPAFLIYCLFELSKVFPPLDLVDFMVRQNTISRHSAMFIPIALIALLSPVSSIYQSNIEMSSLGKEFQPRDLAQLILQTTMASRLRCSAACHQRPLCRALDFDSASRRCRLFEGDLTTGTIVASASATSSVGVVTVLASMFSASHNQSCSACQESRYETCSAVTSRCQCGPHSFWNGSQCSLQQFEGDSCSQMDGCREDLNLTCSVDYYGNFANCSLGRCGHHRQRS